MSPSRRRDALTRIQAAARWVVLAPAALGAAFISGRLVAEVPTSGWTVPAYGLSLLWGFVYVVTALYAGYRTAPAHKSAATVVLGVLLLGDLVFVHLILPSDIVPGLADLENAGGVFGILLHTLQGDAFADLRYGGQARLVGAFAGCAVVWRWNTRPG